MKKVTDRDIKKLKQFLLRDAKNLSQMTYHFGYKTTQTIQSWIYRSAIPARKAGQVQEYLKKRA